MPVLARAFLLLVFVMTIVGGTVFGIANKRVNRVHDMAPPPIGRATDPVELERGGRLFRTNCMDCHAGAPLTGGGQEAAVRRPIGGRVTGAPSFLGEVWAPNLTADVETGIGGWTDGQLARLLRNGVGREGRYAATMPRFGRLGDGDVAALIGFLRSADPLVAPVKNQVPRPGLTVAGTLALAFAAGVDTRGPPQLPMPARGTTAAYGAYLAAAVYGCVDCHTEGFVGTEEKLRSPMLLAGGQFHRSPRGEPIYSSNLTPDAATGLQGVKTADELAVLLTTGMRQDGLPVRPPMPVFRYLSADEAAALFSYLRSVPPVSRRTPGAPREPVALTAPPALLFVTLGCTGCHGEGAPHAAALKAAAAVRTTGELASRIRHPEQQRPDTAMPTYAAAVDEGTALRLATWLKETGGAAPPQ